jgi:hypothetical protein
MSKDTSGKHMVWTLAPGAAAEIGLGYSSFTEAEAEAGKLASRGYKILRIAPITLPKPNS